MIYWIINNLLQLSQQPLVNSGMAERP